MSEQEHPYQMNSDVWPGLAKLVEELGELSQVLGKIIAVNGAENYDHLDGTDLKVRLVEELGDVLASICFLTQHNGIDLDAVLARSRKKQILFEKWADS